MLMDRYRRKSEVWTHRCLDLGVHQSLNDGWNDEAVRDGLKRFVRPEQVRWREVQDQKTHPPPTCSKAEGEQRFRLTVSIIKPEPCMAFKVV